MNNESQREVLELGDGHRLRFVSWAPDRSINPQYADLVDVERYGAIVEHPPGPKYKGDSGKCEGYIHFKLPSHARLLSPKEPTWTVQSWEPLTLTPSLLCSCGDHGFIRGGKWVRA